MKVLPDSVLAATRRTALRAALALIGVIIALGGVWWMARAAFTWLLEVMHPGWAACITGGGMLVLASLLCLPLLAGGRQKALPRRPPPPMEADSTSAMAAMAGQEVARAVRERPGTATIAALAAGLAVGYSPKLRRALLDLLR